MEIEVGMPSSVILSEAKDPFACAKLLVHATDPSLRSG